MNTRALIVLIVFVLSLRDTIGAEKPAPLLVKLGIEKDERKIVTQIYDAAVNPDDLKKGVGFFLKHADEACRAEASKRGKRVNSIAGIAGTCLEYSLIVALKQRGKSPIYWQAEFKGFKENFFDVTVFTKDGPVILSAKTSLRERYKQADLEGLALKRIFPKVKSYLVTLDEDKLHVAKVRKKIADGDITGLDALWDETNADELFKTLDAQTFVEPEPKTLLSGRMIR